MLGSDLSKRLLNTIGVGGFLHHAQGKWYLGEPLPRWSTELCWRKDERKIWFNPNLLAAIGQTSIDDIPVPVLQSILTYHVVQGKVASSMVSAGDVAALSGEHLMFTTSNGIQVNGVDVITPFDVEATNGIVHTIGEVLVPPTIAPMVNSVLEPAYFNKNFSALVGAVVKADLVSTLLDTPNLTIFAPTNDAFTTSGVDIDAIDAATLGSVLTYHVVGAKVLSSAIPASAATVNGNNINFSLHLMRLPQELQDYVILHELAHTKEKNHQPPFWKLLDTVTEGKAKILDKQVKKYSTRIY